MTGALRGQTAACAYCYCVHPLAQAVQEAVQEAVQAVKEEGIKFDVRANLYTLLAISGACRPCQEWVKTSSSGRQLCCPVFTVQSALTCDSMQLIVVGSGVTGACLGLAHR